MRYTPGMKIMQGLGSITLIALVLGAICLPPAEAAYKPKITSKMGGQFTKEVQKVVTTLKALPKAVRWTFLAEKLGLLFMPPNGVSGHNSNKGFMQDGSHFIGADGIEYDAVSECNARPKNPDTWNNCATSLDRLGREVVLSKLSSEVTALALANAKYHLEKMAEEQLERRDMYLAYLAKLCYLPGGKSPYEKMETTNGPHKQPIRYYELSGKGCKFVDTEGSEHNFDDISKKYASLGGARWEILNVCAHHVGAKDILALYPDEVKKLRTNYKKKMQEFTDTSNAGAEKKETGDTKAEKQKTLDDQRAACKDLVNMLRNRPLQQRQSLFAWYLGLRYNGNNSFMASNGNQYNFWDEIWHMGGWEYMGRLTKHAGGIYLVIASFKQEVAELRQR